MIRRSNKGRMITKRRRCEERTKKREDHKKNEIKKKQNGEEEEKMEEDVYLRSIFIKHLESYIIFTLLTKPENREEIESN